MNPYHFSDPAIRAAAFKLATALEAFDTIATAALESAQQRIDQLETKGAPHETENATRNADNILALPLRTATPEPQNVTMYGVTNVDRAMAQMLKSFEPLVTMGDHQDIDASRADYSCGLSGRLSS